MWLNRIIITEIELIAFMNLRISITTKKNERISMTYVYIVSNYVITSLHCVV